MLLLTLSFFLSPSSYACNNGHKTEITSKEKNSCSKKCCENKHSKKEKHNCNGKCSHSGCNTSTFQSIILNSNNFDLENDVFNFSLKSTFSYYPEVTISSGFTSIWLKPKI
ncbi:hypothetical protein [Flavobacterium sp. ACN6]|uniref:hypothetical protein n=1 Tax=Flavobacterium sp. ACN6 TaxID=1920426 RepID=UPI000BB2F57E|nr:hypothetical protein [Flavobacterium sp. ACN6]PBJ13728.1 hypothetical protein BSF42_12040 [Flavobacterium sp. ACN6]